MCIYIYIYIYTHGKLTCNTTQHTITPRHKDDSTRMHTHNSYGGITIISTTYMSECHLKQENNYMLQTHNNHVFELLKRRLLK